MKTLEMILEQLEAKAMFHEEGLEIEILEAFGDYSYNGCDKIVTIKKGSKIEAYADTEGSPILVVEIEKSNNKKDDLVAIKKIYIK